MLRRFLFFLFALGLVLIALSFAGRLHPIGDSLAVFRYWITLAVLVLVVLLVRGWRRVPALVLLLLAFFIEPMLVALSPPVTDQGTYALYQKNVLYSNSRHEALLADIRAVDPDFVSLQEIGSNARPLYEELTREFASHSACIDRSVAAIGILSRFPRTKAEPICSSKAGFNAMQVETPDGPVWLVGIHLRWPWPKSQPENLKVVIPLLEELDGKIVMAGDFNAVPWSVALRDMERVTGTERVGPILRTLVGVSDFLRLPIDHVFVPGGKGVLETRPRLGSDHMGLHARFDL